MSDIEEVLPADNEIEEDDRPYMEEQKPLKPKKKDY